jgi:hypothetical protein
MKIKMNVKTYFLASLLLSQTAHSGIVGIRSTNSSGASGQSSSTSVTVTPGKNVDEKIVLAEGASRPSCSLDQDSSTYFPLDFFKSISTDGTVPSFEIGKNKTIHVKFPMMIKDCGEFKPQLYQDPVTKNKTVFIQLKNGKSYSQYLACMKEKKFLVDNKIDHDKITGSHYANSNFDLKYDFEKSQDIKKSIKLSFGYPIAFSGKDGYDSTFGIDKDVSLPQCMMAEQIASETTYINKGQDVLLLEYQNICKSGDSQKIAEAIKSIGNAEALKDISVKISAELQVGYLGAVREEMKATYEKMTKIEDKFSQNGETMDEAKAKKLASEYSGLARDLDSKLLNPALTHLNDLIIEGEKLDEEDPRRKVIDEEIKKINEDVGAFDARKEKLAPLYAVIEKYAINDSAKTIRDIQLKSFYYGQVYIGPHDEKRGKAITFEEAGKRQYKSMQNFGRILNDWSDQYQVSKGIYYPIQRTEREKAATFQE